MRFIMVARAIAGTAGQASDAKAQHAYRLGSIDAYAGRAMRDMADAASAWLMTEFGETTETTAANWPARLAMCDAYEDGYYAAMSALGGQA
jgi:hypothetical protein